MDPYISGRDAYAAGDPREVPYRFAKRSYDGADVLFLQGWDDALAEGEPRRELIKVSGVVDLRSGWRQRLGK